MSTDVAEPLMPWLDSIWTSLWRAHRLDRLPHALLFAGPLGVGKRGLARHLARSLLCEAPSDRGQACGQCQECHLFGADTHPDFVVLAPDGAAKTAEIKVDTVRELVRTESLTASRGGYKIVLVEPAEAMNPAAANALLKTLEEPSSATMLCLVCEDPGDLPATIRSRCQKHRVAVPPRADGLEWLGGRLTNPSEAGLLLDQACGAPLRALQIADPALQERRRARFEGLRAIAAGERDPVSEASGWHADDPRLSLDWFTGWLSDLLCLAVGVDRGLINSDQKPVLSGLLTRLNRAACHRLLQRVLDIRAAASGNLNLQSQIESLLIEWARVARGGS